MTGPSDRSAEASAPRSPEQRRAANALQAVKLLPDSPDLRKKYRAYVDRIGPAILMNGLGQALATEHAAAGSAPQKADERAHGSLYRNLEAWLCRAGGVYGAGDLLTAIVGGSEALYVRAQTEALGWLIWHKKFCRAYLPASEREDA